MRSTRAATTALPCSGLWTTYVRAMMDPDHRLVLRWCAHLDFEDVLRIDRGSIHAALSDPARSLGAWRIVFGNGRLPLAMVPGGLVLTTHRYAGAVVSQFAPSSKTQPHCFPLRNATMSALALGTVVVEAADSSGSLIQARKALEQGRKLFIPRSAFENTSVSWPRSMPHWAHWYLLRLTTSLRACRRKPSSGGRTPL